LGGGGVFGGGAGHGILGVFATRQASAGIGLEGERPRRL
jgi:hypothetical protein